MSKSSDKRINIYFITIVITLGGLLFGYDTGVINGTQFYFSKYFELRQPLLIDFSDDVTLIRGKSDLVFSSYFLQFIPSIHKVLYFS